MQTLVYCTDSSEYWMVKILETKTSQCQTRKISYFLLCQMDNVCMLAEYSEYFKFSLNSAVCLAMLTACQARSSFLHF